MVSKKWVLIENVGDIFETILQADSKEAAVQEAKAIWERLSPYDKKRRKEFYVVFAVVDEDGIADLDTGMECVNLMEKKADITERVDICTINLNEGEGRQTIYLDPEDHLLHTDYDGSECYGLECYTLSEAQDAAWELWGKSGYWFLEWIEHDDD